MYTEIVKYADRFSDLFYNTYGRLLFENAKIVSAIHMENTNGN